MKFRRLASAMLAVIMVGVNIFNGILPVMADVDDPTIKNPDPVTLDDGVVLSKTVRSVPGYANKWEITLRIESPKTEKTSDTVLVIDRSGSMGGGSGRLTAAKAAARSLARQLLPEGNNTNRVGVVSFASSASNSGTGTGFTDDYDTVSAAIGHMNADGGTYTQSAIHMAAEMLSSSTADIKTMILLSDGEPTYSVSFTDAAKSDDDNFITYGNALETSSDVDQSVFNYTDTGRVGSGSDLRQCMQRGRWGNCIKYYNNGNSAIAEAGYYKAAGGTIYTIALDAGTVGTPILKAIASPNKHYTATNDGLTKIFNEIGGNILSLIQKASVEDTMGHGVAISGTDGKTSLEWRPEFEYDKEKGVFVAEKTYEVEMNEEVYDQATTDGFYALNESATLTYNDGKTGEFPIPKAKPFGLIVEKVLTVDGEEKIGEEFKFKIYGNGTIDTYSVKSGEDHVVLVPMPIKIGEEYTVVEVGVGDNNEIPFEYYDAPEYTVEYNGVKSKTNKFTITEQHGDAIDVVIKNNYETTTVNVSKVWDDNDDRDGLRKNYSNLYAAVKDGSKYVAYEKLDLSDDKDYSFEGLPKNRNGSVINYTVVEAKDCAESDKGITCKGEFSGDSDYEVKIEDGVITNKHEPEMTELTIKKKWDTSAGTLPTTTPGFVTIEVSNDKNSTVESVVLEGKAYNEWTGKFKGYKYENGQEINYSVKEKDVAGAALNTNNTLYVYEDEVLEGKWVATKSGVEVTNTWTPAKTVYAGAGEFHIKKTDQDGRALAGVVFMVGDKKYTTGSDGEVKVKFSKSTEKPENKYVFKITEIEAPEYYGIIDGTEVIEATTTLKNEVDEENLTNTYTKTFEFEVKTAIDGYVWRNNDTTLLVTDQALANELKIEKSFEGISAEVFKEKSQIEFKVSGPDGFTEMTVKNGDKECKVSGNKLTCVIDGSEVLLPIGKYTVTESNADIENFTYTSEPSSKKIEKTVELGGTAKFKFRNIYESVKTASFKVKKVWDDDNDRDGVRPDKLEVTLLADGEAYGDPVELEGDGWEYEWTELPLVNKDAKEIEYIVEEEDLGDDYDSDDGKIDENGVFILTNTHEPEKYDGTGELTVQKLWDGKGNDLVKPNTVTIRLYAETKNNEGEIKTWAVGQPVEISEASNWAWTFTDLYKYDNGLEITYSVEESKLGEIAFSEGENVIVIYRDDAEIENGRWEKVISGANITNTWTRSMAKSFTIKKTTVGLKAEVLNDLEFTITGPKDFGKDGEMMVKIGKGCTVSDYEITCMIDAEIPTGVYTVKESNAEVENFNLTVLGDNNARKEVDRGDEVVFEITNKYEADKTTYRVVKIWQDKHNKDGVRPAELKVELLANGEIVNTEVLSADDETEGEWGEDLESSDVWEYIFEDLPVADENAEIIEYYAEEVLETEEYEQVDEISDDRITIFVNMHESKEDEGYGGSPMVPETGGLTKLVKTDSEDLASVNIAVSVITIIGVSLVGAVFMFTKRKR